MEEIHLASLAAKGAFLDPTLLPPQTVLEMATVNGAEAQGRADCGVIETGKKADFIILDLDKPHLIPKHDILANVVYSAQASDIYMTVIDGRVVYKEGEFLTIDRERVQYEADRRTQHGGDYLSCSSAGKKLCNSCGASVPVLRNRPGYVRMYSG